MSICALCLVRALDLLVTLPGNLLFITLNPTFYTYPELVRGNQLFQSVVWVLLRHCIRGIVRSANLSDLLNLTVLVRLPDRQDIDHQPLLQSGT